jgi:hypothetical protein
MMFKHVKCLLQNCLATVSIRESIIQPNIKLVLINIIYFSMNDSSNSNSTLIELTNLDTVIIDRLVSVGKNLNS